MFEGRGGEAALYENPIQKDHPKWCVNELTVGANSVVHSLVHICEEHIDSNTCPKVEELKVRKHQCPLLFR